MRFGALPARLTPARWATHGWRSGRDPGAAPAGHGDGGAAAASRDGCGDRGSAVVEFSLVAVLLLILLLSIVQVALYLHVRNEATASAAEGARYAANADVGADEGARRAGEIMARGLGTETAGRMTCVGGEVDGPGGVPLTSVRCGGALPVFFAPLGDVLPIHVGGHAVEEDQPPAGDTGADRPGGRA